MQKKLSIEQIDPNFASATVDCSDVEFYSPRQAPMRIYGLYEPEKNGAFHRMPYEVAAKLNHRIERLNTHTSGGRIRFKTDAKKIVVKSVLPTVEFMKHMPLSGSACFDMYADGRFTKNFLPNFDIFDIKTYGDLKDRGFYGFFNFPDSKMREIELYFPLYNPVDDVMIGLSIGATVEAAEDYRVETPVVYYGSSITQGGCASHPGNCYPSILSRRLGCNYVNLGFSGNAKGEQLMAEYIAGLKMSAFVLDYDHNASNAQYLRETHEAFFKTIRKAQPELPIVIVSVADQIFTDRMERREIILQTYNNAVADGDKNVYFVDGAHIYDLPGVELCTVDKCHPNDLGFWCMANAIEKPLAEILK